MGRRAETKVGRVYFVPVHTRYVVVQYRSGTALGAVGRPSEILILFNRIRTGKGLKPKIRRTSQLQLYLFSPTLCLITDITSVAQACMQAWPHLRALLRTLCAIGQLPARAQDP